MEAYKKVINYLNDVREKKPLIHHITNYVTTNDCANIVLALGASPVMADETEEVEEMVSIASSLVINIGTINNRTLTSMLKAGKKANEIGVPVILDPVGAGATEYRKNAVERLISEIKFSVIRGNLAEIKTICGFEAASKGVDSTENEDGVSETIQAAKNLAVKLKTVIAITGKADVITDGKKVYIVENGHEMMKNVTGTGCMSTSVIGSYCSVTKDYVLAAVAGLITMGVAGEKAYERLISIDGTGSYRMYIIDAISNISGDEIVRRGKLNEG